MPWWWNPRAPTTGLHPPQKYFLFILSLLSCALSVTPCLSLLHTHKNTMGGVPILWTRGQELNSSYWTALIKSAWQKLENWNPLLAQILGDFVACWATGPLIRNFSEDDFGMANGYDLAAVGPRCQARQWPFLILLLALLSMSRGLGCF